MDIGIALLVLAAVAGFVFGLFVMAALTLASRADDVVERWQEEQSEGRTWGSIH